MIEHVPRELDVAILLKILLGRKHCLRVEIASINPQLGYQAALDRYQPRAVGVPWFHRASMHRNMLRTLPEWGEDVRLINVCWEQLLSRVNARHRVVSDEFSLRFVHHHVWGEFARERLLQRGVPGSHIFRGGNPALSLYRAPYRAYYPTRAELAETHRLDPSRRWVLVPDQFTAAFWREADLERKRARGFSDDELATLRAYDTSCFQTCALWLAALARDEHVEVIVRPRPAHARGRIRAALEEEVGELPRHMHVNKVGSIRPWILAADVVASTYSTTLIEAAWAGTHHLMITPTDRPDLHDAPWFPAANEVRDQAAFRSGCLGPIPASDVPSALRDWAGEHLSRGDDPLASLAEGLAQIIRGPALPAPKAGVDFEPAAPDVEPVFFEEPSDRFSRWRRRLAETWVQGWRQVGVDALAPPGEEFAGSLDPRLRRVCLNLAKGRAPWTKARVAVHDDVHEDDAVLAADIEQRLLAWGRVLEG